MSEKVPAPSGPGTLSSRESPGAVLVIDDEVFVREALELYFETLGFEVRSAESGEKALELLDNPAVHVDAVILDLVMPGISGIEVLKILKVKDPDLEVIITTGCGNMASAIEALRLGAFDYITKPIINFDEDLLKIVQEAIGNRRRKLKAPPAPQGVPASVESACGALLAQLTEMALLSNRQREGAPVLERIEEILRKAFHVGGGVVIHRSQAGQFTLIYSWGFSIPLCPQSDHLPGSRVFAAVRDAEFAFFATTDLDASWLGVEPGDLCQWRRLACLPLIIGGNIWGSLFLFLCQDLPPDLSTPDERHPFQILIPILSSVFSGALKHSH